MDKRLNGPRASMLAAVPLAVAALLASPVAYCADAAAAQELMRQSMCAKCHSVDKAKVGPSYKDTAAKYKADKDAEAKLVKHLSGGGKIKRSDGAEESHPVAKAKSPADTKNLVGWILSQ